MTAERSSSADNRPANALPVQMVLVQRSAASKWIVRLLVVALGVCFLVMFSMHSKYRQYFSSAEPPNEKFHSGSKTAGDKFALVEMTGTVMPPFTGRVIKSVQRARDDDAVKAVILVIDSPGGFVADSHQIYHELKKLSEKKPMAVVMKRTAASGGYYVAMGAGPEATIYAEPTTWTGSIGVIVPRYNASELANEKLGVRSEPIVTGRFKDSLNPFRDLRDDERELWAELVGDSFDRFLQVIAENRNPLERRDSRLLGWNGAASLVLQKKIGQRPEQTVEHYASGRVFTSRQAREAGLIDKIGFLDDAVEELKTKTELSDVRVVRYQFPTTLLSMLSGAAKSQQPEWQWRQLHNLAVPRPMYYCSSLPFIPAPAADD